MDRETKDSAFCSSSVNYAAGRFCILITIPFRKGYRLEEAGISRRQLRRLHSLPCTAIHRLIALMRRDRRSFVSCGTIPRVERSSNKSLSLSRLSRADFSRARCPSREGKRGGDDEFILSNAPTLVGGELERELDRDAG